MKRYNSILIILHWLMFPLIIGMVVVGWVMTDEIFDKSTTYQLYQAHKSMGVIILAAIFIRLFVKILSKSPEEIASSSNLEKKLAKLGHLALYLSIILIVLSGWMMVSSSPLGLPTVVFGLFTFPHIPGVQGIEWLNEASKEVHELAVNLFLVLFALHIAAVIKHVVFDKVNILKRMWWSKTIIAITFLVGSSLIVYADEIKSNYSINYEKSSVSFSGVHVGNKFEGAFETWEGKIYFDKEDVNKSQVSFMIDPKSFKTGDTVYDNTILQEDWLDTQNHERIEFISKSIVKSENSDELNVIGDLIIKGITNEASFIVKHSSLDNSVVNIDVISQIDRTLWEIGKKSDPNGEWVDKTITINAKMALKAL